jgi:alkylhydroperoxidase family enzyme
MEQMYLPEVERHLGDSPWAAAIVHLRAAGAPVPQIMHLFDFKTEATQHLARFTQAVMRGPSPLSPGQRELIAAFTSRLNGCEF